MNTLAEDSDILVVNKSAGCVVEGPSKNGVLSLVDSIRKEYGVTVYPCHRLDLNTTGAVVLAKNKKALVAINEQFASKRVRKTYLARVDGNWDPSWNLVRTLISRNADGSMQNGETGKEAITTFRRLANWDNKSLVEVLPKTGRTHQIRLHTALHNCPISGDTRYGVKTEVTYPMALHARNLKLKHPRTQEPLDIFAPLPDYWYTYWLRNCPLEV